MDLKEYMLFLILYLFLENLIFICSKYKPIKKTNTIKFDKKINTIKSDRAEKWVIHFILYILINRKC